MEAFGGWMNIDIKGDGFYETLVEEDGTIRVRPAWISVKDRLPESKSEILMSDGDVVVKGIYEFTESQGFYFEFADWKYFERIEDEIEITHWMILPPPPKISMEST